MNAKERPLRPPGLQSDENLLGAGSGAPSGASQEGCLPFDRPLLEKARERQSLAEALADARQQLHREERMPAEVEEALGHPEIGDPQDVRPDTQEGELQLVAGRHAARSRPAL